MTLPPVLAEGVGHVGLRWFDVPDTVTAEVRRVFVWLPPGEPPEAGWPSLVLTDGNAVIATAIDAMRAQALDPAGTNLGWGVLIGVGYPTDEAYDLLRRSWDLGPPPGATYPPFRPGTPEVRTGGGAELARFLREDVRELVTGLTRLDAARRGLFGHSFGGLFALWLMFCRPDAFTHWIAASPSISWEGGFLLAHRDAFDPGGRELRVHLSAGEWEGGILPPFRRKAAPDAGESSVPPDDTLDATRELAARLAAIPGIQVEYETYADETHMSVLPVAVSRALRVVFSRPG
ncbi:alpha/beta hydrolase [Microbacterium sp.]|uniref:alpha/beta hydrolase n=1 Tax=Microbacterium sp. TaxID=51671 RepID=UPI0039E67571